MWMCTVLPRPVLPVRTGINFRPSRKNPRKPDSVRFQFKVSAEKKEISDSPIQQPGSSWLDSIPDRSPIEWKSFVAFETFYFVSCFRCWWIVRKRRRRLRNIQFRRLRVVAGISSRCGCVNVQFPLWLSHRVSMSFLKLYSLGYDTSLIKSDEFMFFFFQSDERSDSFSGERARLRREFYSWRSCGKYIHRRSFYWKHLLRLGGRQARMSPNFSNSHRSIDSRRVDEVLNFRIE